MANPLPPTVGERLSACGTQVEVWGIIPGANVDLDVGGVTLSANVNAIAHTFVVPPLAAGMKVSARQAAAGFTSNAGNVVVVEDVQLPPIPPVTDPEFARCAHCIQAWGVAPGSTIRIFAGHQEVASGTANGQGFACMDVAQRMPTPLYAQVRTCGQVSADRQLGIYERADPIPAPKMMEPIFECQTAILFQQLVPGAIYEIQVTDGGGATSSLGSFCACAPSVNVNTGRSMKPGDRLKAIGKMDNPEWGCRVPGMMSDEVAVVPPDNHIKPQILTPIFAGEPQILVVNQIGGATLTLFRKPAGGANPDLIGERPANPDHAEVSVGTALLAGDIIHVSQQLCGVVIDSDPVTIQGVPPQLLPVKIREPAHACAGLVMVEKAVPGADVIVKMVKSGQAGPEIPIGKCRAYASIVSVPVSPAPMKTFDLVAYQQIASGPLSPPSARASVQELVPMPPAIEPPVRGGDSQIWCDNLVLGAYVRLYEIRQAGGNIVRVQIGGGLASAPSGPIPVWGIARDGARIEATQALCTEGRPSAEISARKDACDGPPNYNPAIWNVPGVVELNNCYNYATDKRTDSFAQPGPGDTTDSDCQCSTISARAIGDKLRKCEHGSCHPCHHKVALVMDPGNDYHWYRQDTDGSWSHKPGGTASRNTDNSGDAIHNPETADRGGYTQFCGYFCVYKPEVTVF